GTPKGKKTSNKQTHAGRWCDFDLQIVAQLTCEVVACLGNEHETAYVTKDVKERLRNETSELKETNKAFENKLKMQIKKLQEDNEELKNQILAMELKSRKVMDF
ncbi:38710_t:CDS:2, partial [Gigaspora margarita]